MAHLKLLLIGGPSYAISKRTQQTIETTLPCLTSMCIEEAFSFDAFSRPTWGLSLSSTERKRPEL